MKPWLLASIPTALPIAAYIFVGLSPSSRPTSEADYFVYGQQVSASDYANTSVGYALQMAAMLLFASWAAMYGLGALWTPLFWALGFALLVALLPKFMAFHMHATTMHDYLSQVFGQSKTLQKLAAAATVLGLMGTLMTEIDYTVQLYSPVLPSKHGQEVLGACFLIFGLFYIVLNGFRAEVNTERIQIPVAYICLWGALLMMLPRVWAHSGIRPFVAIIGLLDYTPLLNYIAKLRISWSTASKDPQTLIPIVAMAGLTLVVLFLYKVPSGHATSVLSQSLETQLKAQGGLALISLLFANALWMPVDLSTWQRIASVRGTNGELLDSLNRGTWRTFFESPATWLLGVALGLSINAGGFLNAGSDPNNTLPDFASNVLGMAHSSGSLYGVGLYWLLLVAAVTIMLSTVHCMISAVSFTLYRDFARASGRASLHRARFATALAVIVGALGYHELRSYFAANLPTLVYGAYSAQLSLFFVALLGLLVKRLDKDAAIASVCAGLAGTVLSVVLAIKINTPSSAVLPPIFAILFSAAAYVIVFAFRARRQAGT